MDRRLPAAHAGFVFMCRRKRPCRRSLPIDRGNILDKCVMFGSVWRLCSCGQWHANRKPTRVQQCQPQRGIGSELPDNSAVGLLTSNLQDLAVVAGPVALRVSLAPKFLPVRPSRCVAAHREHRWYCVDEATEKPTKKKTERLREAASDTRSTVQRRTADTHKEDKPMEDLRINPTISPKKEFTWTRKPGEVKRTSHGEGTEL